jgi:hypothetical protein
MNAIRNRENGMDIKTATPKEIDTRLGEIAEGRWPLFDRIAAARRLIASADHHQSFRAHCKERGEKALVIATAKLEAYNAEHKEEEDALNAEFRLRGGWTRYYLVAGGHFHRSTHCSTCRWSTRLGWVPEMSDKDEAVAIEKFGHLICTVCFPDAPLIDAPIDPSVCEHSGKYVRECPKYGMSPAQKMNTCECGNHSQLTAGGKIRKHKPGKN